MVEVKRGLMDGPEDDCSFVACLPACFLLLLKLEKNSLLWTGTFGLCLSLSASPSRSLVSRHRHLCSRPDLNLPST